jgi:hypothetical protein
MARRLRLEHRGAVYHVINRGNYRRDVFAGEKTKAAFERCLFQACEIAIQGRPPPGAGRPAGSEREEKFIST